MNDKLDILCYYDNLQECLFDLFFYPGYEKYLKTNFNLICHKFDTDKNTIGGWNSKHWGKILIDRYDFIKAYILSNNNRWSIFSDIDILFLDNFYNEIRSLISDNSYNIYYMPEYIRSRNSEINGGFFLFKCNKQVYDFFDLVQNQTKEMKYPNDQIVISELLKNKIINQSLLLRHGFVTNNNPKCKINRLISYGTMKVFHATSCHTTMEKIQVLSTVYVKKYGTITNSLWIPSET